VLLEKRDRSLAITVDQVTTRQEIPSSDSDESFLLRSGAGAVLVRSNDHSKDVEVEDVVVLTPLAGGSKTKSALSRG
jgi:hypothetical protein